jgi:SMODS-associated and fused to various effectors sensor domain/SAVED-fused 2TM effector domain
LIDKLLNFIKDFVRLVLVRSLGGNLMKGGLVILGLAIGISFSAKLWINLTWFQFTGTANSSEISSWATIGLVVLGLLMFILGAVHSYRVQKATEALASRKRVLCIQLNGLSDGIIPQISDAVPAEVPGVRISRTIDIREILKGGDRLTDAVLEVNALPRQLQQDINGKSVGDYTIFVGGLAPVPFLFLFGNILGDKSAIHLMDWHRDDRRWVSIDTGITVDAWSLPDVSSVSAGEIVLCMGVTYPISDSAIATAFPEISVVRWEPQIRILGKVISEDSCKRLAVHFRDLLDLLKERGVTRIHILLAASSTLCMSLGSTFDARNRVSIVVYQYEQSSSNPYPWGITLTAKDGKTTGELIKSIG